MGVEEDLLIDKFDETVLAHITGTTTIEEYIDSWEAAVAAAISATNTNYQEFQSNLTSCLEVAELNSGAFAEAVDADMSEVNDALVETEDETDKLVDTFKSDFDKALRYVKDFDSQYATFLENMRKNTNTLVQALNNLIKGFAELDGRAANVISTSNTRIEAAQAELESRSGETRGNNKKEGGVTPPPEDEPPGQDEYYLGETCVSTNWDYAVYNARRLSKDANRVFDYITKNYKAGPLYKYSDGTLSYDPILPGHGTRIQKFDTGGYTGD